MSNQFEPYYKKPLQTNEFYVWEYKSPIEEAIEPPIDEKALFLAECERLREEAKQEGYAQGLALAQHEIDTQKKNLSQWLSIIQEPVQLLDDQLIQDILQTLIHLSAHCIGVELSMHPEKILNLMHTIKNELSSLKEYRQLAMHPEDVLWLQQELESNTLNMHELLVPDASLKRGDFYLKGEHSELDGRIYTRFATLLAKYLQTENFLSPPLI